jgi:hypothetical protein
MDEPPKNIGDLRASGGRIPTTSPRWSPREMMKAFSKLVLSLVPRSTNDRQSGPK